MSARTKARKRALDVLYGSDLRGLPLDATLADHERNRAAAGQPPLAEHTVRLVHGVALNQAQIDELLAESSVGWSLARMPAVDRNLLRIGCLEILYLDDVPDEVAISEAVGLAGELSTDDSDAFVNGVLAHIAERKPALSAKP